MAELIKKTDTLNQGREKLNEAIKDAEQAKGLSEQADNKATQALANSESTQTQLDTIVINGDSSVEAAQARVSADGTAYGTLKQRLDSEHASVTSQLAENTERALTTLKQGKKEAKPSVTFIVDDGATADYTKLLPITQDTGVTFTIALITSRVGTSGYLTWEQIKELKEDYGWEFISHSHTHVNFSDITEEEMEYELKKSKEIMESHGIYPRGFVYPYNSHKDYTAKVVNRYFDYAFSKNDNPVLNVNFPRFNNNAIARVALGSFFDEPSDGEYPTDTSSFEYYKSRIDEAIENDAGIAFVLHSNPMTQEQIDILNDVIDYLRNNQVDILNSSDWFARHGNIVQTGGLYGDFIIDNKGRNSINTDNHVVVSALNEFSVSNDIRDFTFGKVTITPVNTNFAQQEGFPESVGGLLTTYRPTSSYYAVYQTYRPILGSKKEYRRYLTSNNEWTDFETDEEVEIQEHVVVTNLNAHDLGSKIGDFGFQTITYTPISSTFASNNGFPEGLGGQLVTYRLGSSYYACHQEYTPTLGTRKTYKRYLDSNNNWGDFE